MEEVIKVDGLIKRYKDLIAVDNVSFCVVRGEIFGLLGSNGAGKSTLIECILGTKKLDEGSVKVLGLDPILNRQSLFQRVGAQFQECNYQEKIKVGELCEVTQSLYKNPIDFKILLHQFGLEQKIKSFVSELSGGQKQKLFITLALIPNSELVFLDELTTGLDTKARKEVWEKLTDLKQKGLTIFLTSHFMDEVKVLCDRICILKKGKVVFMGTVEEALNASGCSNLEDAYLWFAEGENLV